MLFIALLLLTFKPPTYCIEQDGYVYCYQCFQTPNGSQCALVDSHPADPIPDQQTAMER